MGISRTCRAGSAPVASSNTRARAARQGKGTSSGRREGRFRPRRPTDDARERPDCSRRGGARACERSSSSSGNGSRDRTAVQHRFVHTIVTELCATPHERDEHVRVTDRQFGMTFRATRPTTREIEHAVCEIAERQHRLIRYDQLRELGMSASSIDLRVRSARLRRVHRAVYLVGPLPATDETRWLAAAYAAGPGAVVSGATAAMLWGWKARGDGRIELLTDGPRRRVAGARVKQTRRLPASERDERTAIPVTSVDRTIIEYALAEDPYDTVGLLHEVAYRRQLRIDIVRDSIAGLARSREAGSCRSRSSSTWPGAKGCAAGTSDTCWVSTWRQGSSCRTPMSSSTRCIAPTWSTSCGRGGARSSNSMGRGTTGQALALATSTAMARCATPGYRMLRIPRDRMYGDPELVIRQVRRLLAGYVAAL